MATCMTSPPRRARRTVLNAILEDKQEIHYHEVEEVLTGLNQAVTHPKNIAAQTDVDRTATTLSPSSRSSCSDLGWQRQSQGWDDLYDASDNESQECPSLTSSRPTSTATFATSIRSSVYSTSSRNRYPSITIPATSLWPSISNPHKSSPVPPTPPPKIAVSPAALSMLPRFVPAIYAPPSLDGSISDDQNSNMSAPPTPDIRLVPDHRWSTSNIRVRTESDLVNNADHSDTGTPVEGELAIDTSGNSWNPLLDEFPAIPARMEPQSAGSVPIIDPLGSLNGSSSPPLEGVLLPPDAIATLQHIRLDSSPEPWSETSETNQEMWQLNIPTNAPQSVSNETPRSELSEYSFSSLSIPSPGGFFSSLGPRARHTWAFPSVSNPPTSAVAERFYNLPWGPDAGEVVEHIVEYHEPLVTDDQSTAVPPSSNGPPTAIRISVDTPRQDSYQADSPVSPGADVVEEISRPVVIEYDESYEEELTKQASANLDRTSVWITAQESYLAALRDANPANAIERSETPEKNTEKHVETTLEISPVTSPAKKSVRFAESTIEPRSPPTSPANQDSIYWKGFQVALRQSHRRDIFLHSNTRFDAVQSVRLGLVEKHVDGLLGKFELARPTRPGYKGPFSQAPRNSVAADILEQQAMFSKLEREQMVLAQLCQSVWAIDALRFLNGGSLICSPASKRLVKATATLCSPERAGKRRLRVLDLGGQTTCGWAWHLANDCHNVKIYTVVTEQAEHVNSAIKGPANHRQVSVSCLWRLPFRDNQFDVISARSLHALLKIDFPKGENDDELDLCLRECYRCLKPGGYLEFFVLDAEIAHAGPYAQATSTEFSFNLKTRGYDPVPTKKFLSRLRKTHFTSIKRAWMFLSMGIEPSRPAPLPAAPPPERTEIPLYEAVQGPIGTTADVASMTGLLGGWVWEQWLLKLQIEMGKERSELLKGVGSVFDEGRKNGSGWTSLCGWAMKPGRLSTKNSSS